MRQKRRDGIGRIFMVLMAGIGTALLLAGCTKGVAGSREGNTPGQGTLEDGREAVRQGLKKEQEDSLYDKDNGILEENTLEENTDSGLNAVLISPEGDYIYEGRAQFAGREDFLEAYGFGDAEPVYTYCREDGSLQMEFFMEEGEEGAVCIRYPDRTGQDVQGYVFQGSREVCWDYNPYSLEPREEYVYSGMLPPECEYNEAGQLVHWAVEGTCEEIWGDKEVRPFWGVDFMFREDGTLCQKEYWHNEMLFSTYGQWEKSYFDEQERLEYQSTYITHGTCESYYVYEEGEDDGTDARIPSYRIYLDYDGNQDGCLEKYAAPDAG